ncbi:MAG: hypothetical protein AAF591_17380 [Verrucomicrobiota bacterium]
MWQSIIHQNHATVAKNAGPDFAIVVSGNQNDADFWLDRFQKHAPTIFNQSRDTPILASLEANPMGNFLGTLQSWRDWKNTSPADSHHGVAIMMMVVGSGSRLSPFTQKLNGRKAAFPTPMISNHTGDFINVGELAAGTMNAVIDYLRTRNFEGILIKWGDEMILPGTDLDLGTDDLSQTDFIRFSQGTEPTPELAAHKEWIVADNDSNELEMISRQAHEKLLTRLEPFQDQDVSVRVNLGSLALSFDAIDGLLETFADVLEAPQGKINWDPYFWIALHCEDEAAWQREAQTESELGLTGIADLEKAFPDFFARMQKFKANLKEKKNLSDLSIKVFDFGDVYWADYGLQSRMREHLSDLIVDSPRGAATRALYGLDADRDQNGNLILDSDLPEGLTPTNSVIIGAKITNPDSTLNNAIVVGGEYGTLSIPNGGIAVHSHVDNLSLEDHTAMSFGSQADDLHVPAAGRHTTVQLPGTDPEHFIATESIFDENPDFYDVPILTNPLSFRDLAKKIKDTP